jgi:hypothetical protein
MATKLFQPPQTEFYNRFPENFLLVENQEDRGVIIRAAIDNDSERRKALFIHELAAEGFVTDKYQFMTNCDEESVLGVRWVIDGSWLVELFLSFFTITVVMIGWLSIR